jgi:CheY-like chemotaxis protein
MKPSSHILVIEDDPDIRETLRQVLEMQGYRVDVAAHGREGLDALARGLRPQLILLDLMMPVMNGWDFLAARRAQGREETGRIPVVLISAVRNLEGQRELRDYPFVKKPLDLDMLLDAIERHAAPVAES